MKKIFILSLFPFLVNSQVFSIDSHYIEFADSYTVNNFSANTFLNTFEDISVSYEIIVDSIPIGWDFQNCFPTCYPINTYSIDPMSFPSDSSVYLNGHFYPNNIVGEGLLVMKLSAQHGLYLDTVTWRGEAVFELDLDKDFFKKSSIKTIHDFNGQVVQDFSVGHIFLVTYENNTTKTYYIIR